jgi:IS1 family transposase
MGTFLLAPEKRVAVLAALVDGNSERATERITTEIGPGVNRETIGRYAVTFGVGAQHLHNAMARDLSCSAVELDEIWSYVGKKQARVSAVEHAAGLGEAYTFVGLDRSSRLAITWLVGKRDEATTDAFMADLRARLVVMPAMTSDGFVPYVSAVGKHMGPGVDYAQTVKNYRHGGRRDDHRYEPPREPFMTKHAVFGAPNLGAATTAHLERQNGTMRHFIGRMRRLVLAFSKSPEHHRAAVALGYVHYNLCHVVKTLRVTPAMAAGITDHPWDVAELCEALLSAVPCATPDRKPIAIPVPATTARELPNGRGFLRVVAGSGGPSAPPGPAPVPPVAPAVTVASAASVEPAPAPPVEPGAQLDLLAWRPRPIAPSRLLPPGQLSLFGIDFEPEPPTK